ncbi:hypothetical protein [Hymenobacter psychrophilus]|uniref:Uncharacterized protein n=1 Tax=Hymenobacter psychrophilus TaxID=651662 RepID=A0A1H3PJY3_9BACT|nr:hypothetical protein [Hymenobacter psychrophilus]SDZ01397.1 hypothetical protein SAMN04488069_1362 [Hymenobacter psychrophilus]
MKTTYFGFYFDVLELDFSLHMEQMVVQAENDHKTALLRAAGFIGEDYDGTGPKPNTIRNFIEDKEAFDRLFAILEPDVLTTFNLYSLRFYADCPDGQQNKLFTYSVHQGGHAADLLRRFCAQGFKVRAAFMVVAGSGEKGQQLAPAILEHLAWSGPEQEAKVRAELLTKYPAQVAK